MTDDGGCDMSDNPPGGWTVADGVWNTDIERETTIVQEGANAVHFKSTVASPARLRADYKPVVPGSPQRLRGLLRADDNTKNVQLTALWYTEAKAFVSADNAISGTLPTANDWYEVSLVVDAPVTANFSRVLVGRTTASFNAYAAAARIEPHPVAFSAYLDNVSLQGSPTVIVYDVAVFNYGKLPWNGNPCYDTATGVFTAPAAGVYTFTIEYGIAGFAVNESAFPMLQINSADRAHGQILERATAGSSSSIYSNMSFTDLLAQGDTVRVRTTHAGGNRNLQPDAGNYIPNTFSGFRVE